MAPKTLPDQTYLRECFDYLPEGGILIWRTRPDEHFRHKGAAGRWNRRWAGKPVGCVKKGKIGDDYWGTAINGQPLAVHRIIWKLVFNEEPPEVDHWDSDGLNNSLDNLRAADRFKNGKNRRRTGRYPKGVKPQNSRWQAKISADGVNHYLGTFDTAEQAHAAYCKAATELHGEFANFGEDRHSTHP